MYIHLYYNTRPKRGVCISLVAVLELELEIDFSCLRCTSSLQFSVPAMPVQVGAVLTHDAVVLHRERVLFKRACGRDFGFVLCAELEIELGGRFGCSCEILPRRFADDERAVFFMKSLRCRYRLQIDRHSRSKLVACAAKRFHRDRVSARFIDRQRTRKGCRKTIRGPIDDAAKYDDERRDHQKALFRGELNDFFGLCFGRHMISYE